MGKGSGGGTNTVTNNSAPPPEVMAQYQKLIGQANDLGAQPLQQYSGQMVAPFTSDQNSAFQNINNAQGLAAPYLGKAQGLIDKSQAPIWNSAQQYSPDSINKYYNPYQNDVVNATMANINETNAQQNQQVVGDAISKGAWGGDRAGIAQSELARQQALAGNQTLAGLQQQGFGQAQQEFNQQQGAQINANQANNWLASQGAFGESNLGTTTQNTALSGAAAQLSAGNQQQNLAQSALNIPYEQFLQRQAYPYQNLSWLSSLSTGMGSGMGGTSSTTSPGPSMASQIGGNIMGGAGLLGASGAFGSNGWMAPLASSAWNALPSMASMAAMFSRGGKAPGGFGRGGKTPHMSSGGGNLGLLPDFLQNGFNWSDVGSELMHALPHMLAFLSNGGTVPDSGGFAGGFDSGGIIPDAGASYIPGSVNLTRGNGIPAPPRLEPQSKSDSGGIGSAMNILSQISKGTGKGSSINPDNPLGLSSGSNFSPSDISKIASDFESSGGGFTDFANGFARGGFARPHYDEGGMVTANMNPMMKSAYGNLSGMTDEQLREYGARTGNPMVNQIIQRRQMMPSTQQQPQGFADGGPPSDDDPYDAELSGGSPTLSGPPAPPGLAPPATMKRGFVPDDPGIPKFDGAGAPPINKPDPWLALAAAGFGTAAGTSPHGLQNLGTGMMEGIKNLQQQKDEAAKESYQQGSLKQQGEELYEKARTTRADLFEKSQHEQATEKESAAQLAESSRHNRVTEGQGKFVMSPYGQVLNTRTGEVSGSMPGTASLIPAGADGNPMPRPMGADGKPAPWPELMDHITTVNPDLANATQMIIDGDKKMVAPTSRADPLWKQATLTARMIDPTVSEERYGNKAKFESDNKGQMDTFNTIPSHLKVLEEAAHALDNGDSRALNGIKNAWEKQFGSALPTNMDTARNMVSAEIVKAITGAGGVSDRQDAQEQFNKAASDGQLTGAVGMTKHLIGERINSAAYRYKQTVGGDYYHYIRPEVRDYLGIGGAKPATQAPASTAPSDSDIAYLKANPGKAAHFDAQFGAGSSGKYLGSQGFD